MGERSHRHDVGRRREKDRADKEGIERKESLLLLLLLLLRLLESRSCPESRVGWTSHLLTEFRLIANK
jgi:hypothetical protein